MKKLTKVGFLLSLLVVLFVSQVSAATFKDININHWAKETIQWASEKGIAQGYEDATFRPNNSVTEAEFLALLIRSYEPKKFSYIENKHWADSYYAFAKGMNYPNEGQSSTTKRNHKITREHVAEILAGTQGVNYKGENAIHYLLSKGLAKGKNDAISIAGYDGQGTLTRAEAVQFIRNVLEKGIKDENQNPIIQPRPTEPSDPSDLEPLPKPEPPKNESKPQPIEVKFLNVSEMQNAVDAEMKKLGLTEVSKGTNVVGWQGKGKNDVAYYDNRGMIGFGMGEVNETNMKGLEIMMKQAGIPLNDEIKAVIQSVKEKAGGTNYAEHYDTDKVGISVRELNGTIRINVAKKK